MFNYNIFGPLAQKNRLFSRLFRIFSVPMVTPLNDISGVNSAISHNTFINHLVEPTGYLLKSLTSQNILTKHNTNPISRLG